jgi:PIN domain nuclease of toxin-antitoxin system
LKLLLDTHAALWLLEDDERLPDTARELLFAEDSDCYLSAASVWEVAIKRRLGKLKAPADIHVHIERHGINGLPIYDRHAARVAALARHHGDPFDRLLVAQALEEGMSILSADPVLPRYGVSVVW